MRIAVLGCGSIGRRHLRNLRALGHRELLAFDPSPEARQAAADESGAQQLATLETLWACDPHITFITAPTHQHVELALEAARRGCHLFIEKPLADSLDDVETLCAEAARRGLITMVGCNMRFHPGPARVKRLIDEGAIGQVIAARLETGSYLPDWRPLTDYRRSYSALVAQGGGVVLDCIHELDLALWYLGHGEVVAAAIIPADTLGLEVDGVAEILIRHDDGPLSSVHLNFVQRDYHRSCQVIGTSGTLYWDFTEGRVRCVSAERTELFEQPLGWTLNDMYVDEISSFLQCVTGETPTVNTLENGTATLRAALDARERGRESATRSYPS